MSSRKKILRRKSKKHFTCQSVSTTCPDSYEAGLELGEALKDIEPETVIYFSSFHYDHRDFLDGFYDGLNTRDVIVFGGTGDGFFETAAAAFHGAGAMGFNSGGRVRWSLSVKTGAQKDPEAVTENCARDVLNRLDGSVDMAFLLGHLHCDGVKVTRGAEKILNAPFIGSLTGDDFNFKKGLVFANGEIYNDAVAILGLSGDFSFGMSSSSGWKPQGQTGIVENVEGNTIRTIDGKTPFAFLERQFGSAPAEAAMSMIPLAAYETPDPEEFYLRAPVNIDLDSGWVTYSGSIPSGTPVRVCTAGEDDIAESIKTVLDMIGKLDFEPLCAVAVSCASRKWLLKDQMEMETSWVFDYFGKTLPLIGTPSFGEMGPFRHPDKNYSPVYFHNATYVIVLIGV